MQFFSVKNSSYKYSYFLIFVIQIFPLSAFSQYLGGGADGFALNTLTQTVCSPLASTSIFLGGNADGFALNTLTQTVCTPLASTNIFLGGNADGFALNTLTQTVCPPIASTNIFLGGNADGFALNRLTQTVCPPIASTNIFLGGNADGFALNTLTQTVCPPIASTNIFLGGAADGYAIKVLQQSICPNNTPLPIALLSWEAQCEQKQVVLKWTTASETNNDYFSIERSNDAVNWSVTGKITGAGNSDQFLKYSFTDAASLNELAYYRLIQTDFDGKSKYFNIIVVDCKNNEFKNILVYPNPNTGKFIVKNFAPGDTSEIKIYNFLGKLVLKSKISNGFTEFDLSEHAQGVYNILIISANQITSNKVIINR